MEVGAIPTNMIQSNNISSCSFMHDVFLCQRYMYIPVPTRGCSNSSPLPTLFNHDRHLSCTHLCVLDTQVGLTSHVSNGMALRSTSYMIAADSLIRLVEQSQRQPVQQSHSYSERTDRPCPKPLDPMIIFNHYTSHLILSLSAEIYVDYTFSPQVCILCLI